MQHGILLAIQFQKLLVQTGITILDKKMVKTLKKFQLTVLQTVSSDFTGAAQVFCSSVPLLHRLAGFLMDAFKVFDLT